MTVLPAGQQRRASIFEAITAQNVDSKTIVGGFFSGNSRNTLECKMVVVYPVWWHKKCFTGD